jgi:hypothetical protein
MRTTAIHQLLKTAKPLSVRGHTRVPRIFNSNKKSPTPVAQEKHSHAHAEKLAKHYYGGNLAALLAAAAGGIFALGYEVATGKLHEKITLAWQELNPPAVPGNVEMVSLDSKTLPIPLEIVKELNTGILSNAPKTLLISGEGGAGKFDLACQIAFLLRSQSQKPCSSIFEISGHTKENLENGIIDVAKKLGLKGENILIDDAKNFLRTELFKKHSTFIIVRCLRMEAIVDGVYPLQDVINGFACGLLAPKAYVFYTTGQKEVLQNAKKHRFHEVSLSKSYGVDDLCSYLKSLPETDPLKNKIPTAMMPLFVNHILGNNPALARLAIPYLRNTNTDFNNYINDIITGSADAILTCSLQALQNPLSKPLLEKIAELPQKATSIDALALGVKNESSLSLLLAYQKISSALEELDKLGLIRVDPQRNCVYPLILVRQTNSLQNQVTLQLASQASPSQFSIK